MSKKCTTIIKHLVIRYADSMADNVDTIGMHRKVIENQGHVWVGKIGTPLSAKNVDVFNSQVDVGKATYLYLTTRSGGKYRMYRGRIIIVQNCKPKNNLSSVPAYYKNTPNLNSNIGCWILIENLTTVSQREMSKLHVASSRNPIALTLQKSMSSFFVVVSGKSVRNTSLDINKNSLGVKENESDYPLPDYHDEDDEHYFDKY
jgi:hypothetical protein